MYTPTVWVNTTPPVLSVENLNHAETQYQKVLDDAPVDGATGTPTLRTLGTGSQQAAAGNHTH